MQQNTTWLNFDIYDQLNIQGVWTLSVTRVKYNSKARENWKKEGIERNEFIEWIENYDSKQNRALKS